MKELGDDRITIVEAHERLASKKKEIPGETAALVWKVLKDTICVSDVWSHIVLTGVTARTNPPHHRSH